MGKVNISDVVSLRYALGVRLHLLLGTLTSLGVIGALALVFVVAPDEVMMGPVQRIFYFHVGSAMASYLMIAVMLAGSSFFLVTRHREWDIIAQASAGVGLMFCTIVLLSGSIWGHSAWNTWWRWEPRLVASLALWLILSSYVLLRRFSSGSEQEARFAAVLGIVAALFVPVVIYSIRLLAQNEQLHPQVVGREGLKDPAYVWALLASIGALSLVAIWWCVVRIGGLLLEGELLNLHRKSGADLAGERDGAELRRALSPGGVS